ncbi:MAG: glycosyl hydrolase, partial [Bacteroidota bacterium]
MKTNLLSLIAGITISLLSCNGSHQGLSDHPGLYYPDSKPLTRWWWFASEIQKEDVRHQLEWLKENEFGGVEIAFVYPQGGDTSAPRYRFLGEEFREITSFTKNLCDSLGLYCDFTFGSLWPFGGSFVKNRDA